MVSSFLLLLFGAYCIYEYVVLKRTGSCCEMQDNNGVNDSPESHLHDSKKSVDVAAEMSLWALMAFSPCVGSMPILFALLRPPFDVARAFFTFCALFATSAIVMVSLVGVAFKGANRFNLSALRKHEKLVLGLSLVTLAIATYFVLPYFHSHHHHHHGGDIQSSVAQAHGLESVHSHHHDHEHGFHHHHP